MVVDTNIPAIRFVAADGTEIESSDALQGTWTQEQYLRLSDRNNRPLEFTDGLLEVLCIPTDKHQAISKFLLFFLSAFVEPLGGTVFYSPLRVQIREGKFREPDLMLLLDAGDPRRQQRYWLGTDLVIEIVSPDDPERDTVVKRADYTEGAIPEYWIVNPADETLTVLELNGAEYTEYGTFRRGEKATSPLLPGLRVPVSAVFDAR